MEQAIDWKRHKAEQLLEHINREELIDYIIELEDSRLKLERVETRLKTDYQEIIKAMDTITNEESIPDKEVGKMFCGYIMRYVNIIKEVEQHDTNKRHTRWFNSMEG